MNNTTDLLLGIAWNMRWLFVMLFCVIVGSKVLMKIIKAYKRAK